MISDHTLVLAAAATYDIAAIPSFEADDHALRVFMTKVDGLTIVAIEGTHDPLGWLIDLLAIPTQDHEMKEHPSLGFLHAGFYESANAILPFMDSIEAPFAICGHSLGAALALLIGAMLIDRGRPPVKIGVFAPPRVGGDRFVSVATSVPLCAYRFGDDPVTDVPYTWPDFPYRQVPLTAIGKPLWPAVSCHHIANYVAAFEATKQENVMGDTVQEIEDVVTSLQGVTPTIGALVGALIPGAAPAMTLAVPVLSVINEILAAIETMKSSGASHQTAVAVIGSAVSDIGKTLLGSVPAPVAAAAAPATAPLKS